MHLLQVTPRTQLTCLWNWMLCNPSAQQIVVCRCELWGVICLKNCQFRPLLPEVHSRLKSIHGDTHGSDLWWAPHTRSFRPSRETVSFVSCATREFTLTNWAYNLSKIIYISYNFVLLQIVHKCFKNNKNLQACRYTLRLQIFCSPADNLQTCRFGLQIFLSSYLSR